MGKKEGRGSGAERVGMTWAGLFILCVFLVGLNSVRGTFASHEEQFGRDSALIGSNSQHFRTVGGGGCGRFSGYYDSEWCLVDRVIECKSISHASGNIWVKENGRKVLERSRASFKFFSTAAFQR